MRLKTAFFLSLAMAFGVQGLPVQAQNALVVYSARKEELIKPIFDAFTKDTGIAVTFLSDDSPKLIARLESEGASSPADLLITVDVANLDLATQKGLFKPLQSTALTANVPAAYRDKDGKWYGLSKRARAIFYNKAEVKPEQLSTYENLADPRWKGKILTRSASHPYTLSLLASIIAAQGVEKSQAWANGMVANLARSPQGGDTDQLKALAAGEGSLALANTYYYARMLQSKLPEEREAAAKIGIFFPNQASKPGEMSGAHINISGGGVVATSKQAGNAQKLLEYLTAEAAQRIYADANHEYPVNPKVAPSDVLKSFGSFREDAAPLGDLVKYSKDAVRVVDVAGWK